MAIGIHPRPGGIGSSGQHESARLVLVMGETIVEEVEGAIA
jgi:hypothetical protein